MVAFFSILESMKHSFTPISKIGRTAVLQKLNEFQGASSIPINLLGKKKNRVICFKNSGTVWRQNPIIPAKFTAY
jgi:hypothetical protein